MRTIRRLGFGLGLAAVALALYADLHGLTGPRLGLLVAAAVAAGPAVLHFVLVGMWPARTPSSPPATLSTPPAGLEQLPPMPAGREALPTARVARGGLPPSPRRRQLSA